MQLGWVCDLRQQGEYGLEKWFFTILKTERHISFPIGLMYCSHLPNRVLVSVHTSFKKLNSFPKPNHRWDLPLSFGVCRFTCQSHSSDIISGRFYNSPSDCGNCTLPKTEVEVIYLKIEMFLQTYGTSKPTRYQFSEVKKITRRFKERVGQGGFGSVYKGQLPNGVPVVVKMLENPTGEGEEFINEVATIGRIHHANVVRLLGFCSEGTRRALIYEFIPNESLGKYIFSCNHNASQGLLAPNKMLDIALGVARGMEYLHQGCNQRILHFDIKPHNILLDYSFNPKISDFGLAKLCARDQSIVTLTKARGTMGYIAPEIYSPNFGGISYKSDVYSFGMLVLEMVSGRRNSDPGVENQNEVYLPEWIYDRVINGLNLILDRELTREDKEIATQLAIVALWCIQWNPRNRPSITKVVNMLTGMSRNLQIPPKPFISSEAIPVQ